MHYKKYNNQKAATYTHFNQHNLIPLKIYSNPKVSIIIHCS